MRSTHYPRCGKTNVSMKKITLLALTILSATVIAQPPAKIDVSKLPKESRVVDDVIVPVPSEIFGVLDKLGKPNWAGVLRPLKGVAKPFGEPPQQALYLGSVIAEGFIAVEAGDVAEVKNIGNSVLSLSGALGVRKAVTKRANAIINAADAGNWQLVRKELDGALNEVKDAMTELGSGDLASLVSLGGWLRGTEALCEVVVKNYSKDGADLLHQPALLDHFDSRLGSLKARAKKHPLVPKIQAGLKNIRPLIGLTDGTEISAKSVKEVRDISSGLVKDIQTK
jgi:hypothetical protein